jgi:hypothetical protein
MPWLFELPPEKTGQPKSAAALKPNKAIVKVRFMASPPFAYERHGAFAS